MYNRQLNRANSQKASGARRDKSKAIGAVVVVVIAFLVSSVVYVRVLSCCALVWVLFTRKMLIKVLLNQTEKNLYNRIRVPTEILRNATKSQSWKRNKKKKTKLCLLCGGAHLCSLSLFRSLLSLSLTLTSQSGCGKTSNNNNNSCSSSSSVCLKLYTLSLELSATKLYYNNC